MKQNPTLADVAALAGVSKMTASRALRGAGEVSSGNVEKVRRAAEEIGYVTNHLATSLSSRTTNLIGVVVPSMSNVVFAEVLSGISDAIEGTGKRPVFGISNYDERTEYEIVRDMLSWRPCGLIVSGLEQSPRTRKLLENADIPIAQIMDVDGEPIDINVGLSHGGAGRDMARALIASGLRKFAYVGSAVAQDARARKRKEGFEQALRENGLTLVDERIDGPFSSVALGRQLTHDLLGGKPDIDCIYYSNDDMAAGGLFACSCEGIDVPKDLVLAGFNGLELLDGLPVRLATTRSPRRQIGADATRILLGAIDKPLDPAEKIKIFRPEIDLGAWGGQRAKSA